MFFKTGDASPDPTKGCTLEDSTVALACANPDVNLCMTVKREIGKMFEDVEAPPYTIIFNPSLSAQKMWIAVEVMRVVEKTLKAIQIGFDGKERLIAIHGNRLILHLVFKALGEKALTEDSFDTALASKLPLLTTEVWQKMRDEVENHYSSSYPASLFKNVKKCKEIASAIG